VKKYIMNLCCERKWKKTYFLKEEKRNQMERRRNNVYTEKVMTEEEVIF
jgi:hypothetical protein